MEIEFLKYQGTGNDFIVIDGFAGEFELSTGTIQRLCDRHFGIGADGLILLTPSASESFTMLYYNADGKLGSMCGNGARCAFHMAWSRGYSGTNGSFEAFDGVHTASILPSGDIEVSMSSVGQITSMRIHNGLPEFVLDTGSPHLVRFVETLDGLDVYSEGRSIRYNETFRAAGINVNFVLEQGEALRLRTYERGVEDITLSCGTGATATAIAYADWKKLDHGPVELVTDGGRLHVDFKRTTSGYSNVKLKGPVGMTFRGSFIL